MAMATMLGASGAFKVLFVYTVIIFISYQSVSPQATKSPSIRLGRGPCAIAGPQIPPP